MIPQYRPYPISLIHGHPEWAKAPVRIGDQYAASIGRIDFLKIDTEGAEPLVLQGLDKLFQEHRIDVVQFEYGRVNILNGWLLRDFYVVREGSTTSQF